MFPWTDGKFTDTLHIFKAELEALCLTYPLDVAAIRTLWIKTAESAEHEFLGGIVVNKNKSGIILITLFYKFLTFHLLDAGHAHNVHCRFCRTR